MVNQGKHGEQAFQEEGRLTAAAVWGMLAVARNKTSPASAIGTRGTASTRASGLQLEA